MTGRVKADRIGLLVLVSPCLAVERSLPLELIDKNHHPDWPSPNFKLKKMKQSHKSQKIYLPLTAYAEWGTTPNWKHS